mgnify:CR=1 FL=1
MIPYRAFTHLLTPDDQMQELQLVREHLVDGGKLVINNSDPRLETIVREMAYPEPPLQKMADVVRRDNGNRVVQKVHAVGLPPYLSLRDAVLAEIMRIRRRSSVWRLPTRAFSIWRIAGLGCAKKVSANEPAFSPYN